MRRGSERGAVVYGQAYHKGRVLFGPGVVEAYNRERHAANYPRIIVDEKIRKRNLGFVADMLVHDEDGCWFLNLFRTHLRSSSAWVNLPKIRSLLIKAWRKAQGDTGHMSKVWWLIDNFNKTLPRGSTRVKPIKRVKGTNEIE